MMDGFLIFTKRFWIRTAERAIKSLAQGFIIAVGTAPLGWMTLDWVYVAYASLGMAVLSVAFSILGKTAGPDAQDPSVVK